MAIRNGKGSRRRPQQVSETEMAERWQAAFGKKKRKRSKAKYWNDPKTSEDACLADGGAMRMALRDIREHQDGSGE